MFGDIFTGALLQNINVRGAVRLPAVFYHLCTCINMAAAQLFYSYHQSARAELWEDMWNWAHWVETLTLPLTPPCN